ncbi:DUF896 domain-containing protein [Lactococcus formosensis]|jgi:uncharacterized protein YnzC (UPF0291/DUF896 family)|uniref:DUF896 domain-containing protein n=1 Tax=Lactococcus formosensis TaxID=1281486 RepID=UPI000313322E|nr:DUF896 domain-containing protein [Lactococcus formosensis]MCH1723529.1 DUF896 domain-containing protein [Lactococcus formosensis]
MAITNEQVERINELARKHKAEGLTEAEAAERAELRRIYLDSVRENLRGQVEAVKLVDEDGKDITPEKLKDIQRAKGMRD